MAIPSSFCGGTHIPSTGRIGSCRVLSESSIAAGVRRIEAVTATKSENYTFLLQDTLRELRLLFNNVPNLTQTIRKSIEENAELKKGGGCLYEGEGAGSEETSWRMPSNAKASSGAFKGDANIKAIRDLALQLKGEFDATERSSSWPASRANRNVCADGDDERHARCYRTQRRNPGEGGQDDQAVVADNLTSLYGGRQNPDGGHCCRCYPRIGRTEIKTR